MHRRYIRDTNDNVSYFNRTFNFRQKLESLKCVLLLLFVIAFNNSCKKSDSQINDAALLTSHLWYPYKAEIITSDTNTITTHDSTGVSHAQTAVINMDTTIFLDQCIQNSRFKFQKSGVLNVSNPCNWQNSTIDTTWSIAQNGILTTVSINDPATDKYYARLFSRFFGFAGPIDTTYSFSLTRGPITQINNSQFVFNNIVITSSIDIATVHSDTLNKIISREYTTYRSQ